MKTGSMGRPWVELEQPKPERVADRYSYWGDQPRERSPRCAYWLRQIERGWLPNRRISAECYDCSAEWYGIYIWEYINEIAPAVSMKRDEHEATQARLSLGDLVILFAVEAGMAPLPWQMRFLSAMYAAQDTDRES